MRTRTKGIQLDENGERIVNKQYRGERVFARLGRVSQDEAEAWLRQRQAGIDAQRRDELREGSEQLFRLAAGKYLLELREAADVRTLETIAGHITLLNEWVGEVALQDVCNDTFACFKADRLSGRSGDGKPARKSVEEVPGRDARDFTELGRNGCQQAHDEQLFTGQNRKAAIDPERKFA